MKLLRKDIQVTWDAQEKDNYCTIRSQVMPIVVKRMYPRDLQMWGESILSVRLYLNLFQWGNASSTGCSNSSSHQKRAFIAGPGFNLREFPSRDIHCCSDPLPYRRFPELSIASLFCSTREFPSKVVYFISVPNQIVITMFHLFCLFGFSSFFFFPLVFRDGVSL